MRVFFVFLAISIYTFVISCIWYNKGTKDAIMSQPSAMDMYQGKTTLRYTIVDGEKIDSIMVFKN